MGSEGVYFRLFLNGRLVQCKTEVPKLRLKRCAKKDSKIRNSSSWERAEGYQILLSIMVASFLFSIIVAVIALLNLPGFRSKFICCILGTLNLGGIGRWLCCDSSYSNSWCLLRLMI